VSFNDGRHNNDPTPGDNHGFKYATIPQATKIATIMCVLQDPEFTRPPRWSNPNVYDGGAQTCTETTHNVAKYINQNSEALSAIRSNETLYSLISGPSYVTSIGTYNYSVDYGCSSNHSFQWFTSINGTNYSTVGSNSSSYYQSYYPGSPSTLYVRCIVTGGDGQQSISNIVTSVYISYKVKHNAKSNLIEKINIYPNPSADEVTINLSDEISTNGKLEIVNQVGQIIFSANISDKDRSFRLETKSYTPGIYSAKVSEGSNVISSNFVKN
jgi:hypothetical protein